MSEGMTSPGSQDMHWSPDRTSPERVCLGPAWRGWAVALVQEGVHRGVGRLRGRSLKLGTAVQGRAQGGGSRRTAPRGCVASRYVTGKQWPGWAPLST